MKWKASVVFLLLVSLFRVQAQISEGGLPPGLNYTGLLRSELPAMNIPVVFNVEDQILVDEWRVSEGSPLRVAQALPVDITLENSGQWTVLQSGERVWQLRLQAEGAIALMLYYNVFDIPEGGKFFIYNADKTQILGAYTHRTNPGKGLFATEFVAGDDLTLEYVASSSDDQPKIEIAEIGYGYNHLSVVKSNSLRSSGSCMVNINCPEGAAWQREKAGVCRTVQKIGGGLYICSGSLVNNTAEDFKPYILMAYHCMEGAETETSTTVVSTADDMKQWMFYFNYERQGCSTSTPAVYKTMTGCTKIASTPIDGGSDGLLVLLNQEIPEDYSVYYNGWDRRDALPKSGVGIHHPKGDYKKISTYTSDGTTVSWNGTDHSEGARNAHINIIFEATENGHGVTEGGSSGSPLFNQDHLIVGTLTGGLSSCEKPGESNLYGKLSYHWNKYSTANTARMDVWLDPLATGAETLRGLSRTEAKPGPTDLKLSYTNKAVTLNWVAPVSTVTPSHYNIYRTNQLIGTSTKATYTDQNVSIWGEVVYAVTAEYTGGNESLPLTGSVYVQDFKAPTDLTVSEENSLVSLSWKAPVYTQTISWTVGSPSQRLGAGVDNPLYFGHLWDVDDLTGLNNNLITAVQLYADKDASYSLFLLQGGREYRQAITTPQTSGLIEVGLTTPFVINSSEELLVCIYTTTSKEEVYPIACDAGPAVIGKGNVISEDGKDWYVLYDGENDEQFDLNFYLGTVVSSEKGMVNKSASRSLLTIKQSAPVVSLSAMRSTGSLRAAATKSSQFQYPSAFPKITGYNVYRSSTLLTSQPQSALVYTDRQPPAGTYIYGVAAVYSGEESDKLVSSATAVANEVISPNAVALSPTVFVDFVRIANADQVKRLEVYSISGLLVQQTTKPGEIINTSGLSSGVYIFRLYTDDEVKTYQAIKK